MMQNDVIGRYIWSEAENYTAPCAFVRPTHRGAGPHSQNVNNFHYVATKLRQRALDLQRKLKSYNDDGM